MSGVIVACMSRHVVIVFAGKTSQPAGTCATFGDTRRIDVVQQPRRLPRHSDDAILHTLQETQC